MRYLMSLLGTEPVEIAAEAVDALAVHRYDDRVRKQVEDIARRRDDVNLLMKVRASFAKD